METNTVPTIDVESAAAATGVLLLDIRERDEWYRGRIATAVHIPMSELTARVEELDRSTPIICICRSGNRATTVTQWLIRQGFDTTNLRGGLLAWEAEGHPLVNEAGTAGLVI